MLCSPPPDMLLWGGHTTCSGGLDIVSKCHDRFSSTILLGGPGLQGTNEEVSPDTSRC